MNTFTKYFRILRNKIWFKFQKFEDVVNRERLGSKEATLNKVNTKKLLRNEMAEALDYIGKSSGAKRHKYIEKIRKPLSYYVLKELVNFPFSLDSLREFKDEIQAEKSIYAGLLAVSEDTKSILPNTNAINFYFDNPDIDLDVVGVYVNFFNCSPNIKLNFESYSKDYGTHKDIKKFFYHPSLNEELYEYRVQNDLFNNVLGLHNAIGFYSDFIKSYDKELVELGFVKLHKEIFKITEHYASELEDFFTSTTSMVCVPEIFHNVLAKEDGYIHAKNPVNHSREDLFVSKEVYLSLFTRINLSDPSILGTYLNTLQSYIENDQELVDDDEDLDDYPYDPDVNKVVYDWSLPDEVTKVLDSKIVKLSTLEVGDTFYYLPTRHNFDFASEPEEDYLETQELRYVKLSPYIDGDEMFSKWEVENVVLGSINPNNLEASFLTEVLENYNINGSAENTGGLPTQKMVFEENSIVSLYINNEWIATPSNLLKEGDLFRLINSNSLNVGGTVYRFVFNHGKLRPDTLTTNEFSANVSEVGERHNIKNFVEFNHE